MDEHPASEFTTSVIAFAWLVSAIATVIHPTPLLASTTVVLTGILAVERRE